MSEPTRYFTLNGEVPNAGVPPGRMFAAAAVPPSMPEGPPPPYTYLYFMGPPVASFPTFPVAGPATSPFQAPPMPVPTPVIPGFFGYLSPRIPMFPVPQSSLPPITPATKPYEPPGQTVEGHMMQGPGWSYISPEKHTTIYFVGDGVRPIDNPNGFYPHPFRFSKHKAPCIMTVRELINRLGCPAGDEKGVMEVFPQGNDRWLPGRAFTQGSDDAGKTLAEVGWTEKRDEEVPVWLVVKR